MPAATMVDPMTDGRGATALSRAEAASLLGWWLDAGCDVGISEKPRNWLEAKAASPAPEAGAAHSEGEGQPLPRLPIPTEGEEAAARLPVSPPDTLDAYHSWLATSVDLPLFSAGASRALPHGPEQAEIMLIAGHPSSEDAAEGKPIGGAAWQLAVRMLAAIGLTPDQAYVAALTCFPAAGSKMVSAEQEACRDGLIHQIGLVRPKRLLLLGDQPAKLLLGQAMTTARGRVHRIQHLPAVVTFHPRHLLERSADKALAWRDLLLLMGEPA